MIIRDIFKDAIINEINYVLKKMNESNDTQRKLFYFSAIPAEFLRVLNLEYDQDILYIYHVLSHTYTAFSQRINAIKTGDQNVTIDIKQIEKLEYLLKNIITIIEQKKIINDVLKELIELAYSTSGNGYYLREKGLLKI
jgi:hypothetical protein